MCERVARSYIYRSTEERYTRTVEEIYIKLGVVDVGVVEDDGMRNNVRCGRG